MAREVGNLPTLRSIFRNIWQKGGQFRESTLQVLPGKAWRIWWKGKR